MNHGLYIYMLAAVVVTVLRLGECMTGDGKKEDEGKPAVIVLWHAYNAVAKSVLDDLAMEFSETMGTEQGIIAGPMGYGSNNELDDVLYASASHVVGSDPLPNISASYLDGVHRLGGTVPLIHPDDYSSEEELGAYRLEFLREGIWEGDGICRMIPVAKPTEILYFSETNWEWFARDTGTGREMLKTWEDLAQTAGMRYEQLGDSPFLEMNAFNDFAPLVAAQLGEDICWIQDGFEFSYPRDTARRVWDAHYILHMRGWYGGRIYNQDSVKSGRLMAHTGSSAGASFFPQVVIEDERQYHPIACSSYAYPVFQGGTPYMGQRGSNMVVLSTGESHQQTAVRSLKWFTEPEQNTRFAVTTGYLPVQEKALESVSDLVVHVKSRDSVQAAEESIQTSPDALENHNVCVRETFQGSYDMDQIFSISLENCMNANLEILKQQMEKSKSRESVERELPGEEYSNRWHETLLKEMVGKVDGQEIQR